MGYIYVARPDGSELTRLVQGLEPAWSPDGEWIAYVTMPTSTASISVMRADGTQQRRLGEGRTPSWSPDGTRIAFSTENAIMVMNANGTDRRALVRLGFQGMVPGSNELSHPAWSPDGSRIAFDSRGGTQPMLWRQVYVMEADGTNLHALGQDPFAKSNPSWSPDGTRIAVQTWDYVIGDPNGFDNVIATYDVSTGERAIHYRPHMQWIGYWGPVYSSDGKTLAFTQQVDGFRFRILLLDIATGGYRPFLPEADDPARVAYIDQDPAWSKE
jgi:Tol biopolymer transport system component